MSLRLPPDVQIPEEELSLRAIRAPGPGGQKVNKVATAVQLRFDVRRSPSLPPAIRHRLEALAGNRLTREGVLVLTAHRHRSREANRRDVLERLAKLLAHAARPPKPRRPTRPPRSAERRRLELKRRRARLKQARRTPPPDD